MIWESLNSMSQLNRPLAHCFKMSSLGPKSFNLPFVELWTLLHTFRPYIYQFCQQTASDTVKWHWLVKDYQELEEVTVEYSCYLSFDFKSGFTFRDLFSLHWIGSTLVIDQNQSSEPKSCDYRYLSIILTNRLISIE